MSEENTTQPESAEAPTTPETGQQPGPVPYDRFKQANDKAKQLETQLAELRGQLEARENEGKTQVEQLTDQLTKLQTQFETERIQRQRLEVVTKKGLPPALASRLQGSTTDEMEADADALLQFVKLSEAPGVPPASPRSGQSKPAFDLANMTPDEIRKNANKILRS
jgi:hypothetical protein